MKKILTLMSSGLVAGAVAASAQFTTQTENYLFADVIAPNFNGLSDSVEFITGGFGTPFQLSFSQHDPLLGPLLGVTVFYSGVSHQTTGSLQNVSEQTLSSNTSFEGTPSWVVSSRTQIQLTNPAPSGNLFANPLSLSDVAANDIAPDDTINLFVTSAGPSNSFTLTDPADLAFFTGVGTISFDVNTRRASDVSFGATQNVIDDALLVQLGGSSQGFITVEYTYEFTPIPEPGTIAAGVLFAGLVGFVGYRRFRDKKVESVES